MPVRGPIAVVGLGLVGGSLVKALRASRPGLRIIGVDPVARTRRAALRDGSVDVALRQASPELLACRLVVLAVPIGALDAVLRTLAPHLAHDALVTDVLGVKAPVAAAIRRRLPKTRFVGAHPMAGGEHGGYEHSRADLFQGKPVVVCTAPARDAAVVLELWRRTGARPVRLSADAHDRVIATTSHLPYAAALALVNVAARTPGHHVAGRGFFDATRRAAFTPEIMAAAVAGNPHAPRAMRALAKELERFAALLARGPARFVREAARARAARQKLS